MPDLTFEEFEHAVKTIPGEDGFWKSSAESDYLDAADKLVLKGFSKEEALSILRRLYYAAADCYGG